MYLGELRHCLPRATQNMYWEGFMLALSLEGLAELVAAPIGSYR